MAISAERKALRLMRLRRICGYSAAIAVTPYLLIKIVWTFGFFLPTEQMGDASWRIINAVTAVLAAIGILLAMAFCRPWGERLPAWLVALPIWVGTGLLVPILLIAPILGPAAMIRDQEAGAADFWVYEQIFVMISLFGIGIFLPLALAGYAMARWPEALSGTTDYKELPGNTLQLQIILARIVAAGCILLGVIKVFWAVGGSFGIDQATMEGRDVWVVPAVIEYRCVVLCWCVGHTGGIIPPWIKVVSTSYGSDMDFIGSVVLQQPLFRLIFSSTRCATLPRVPIGMVVDHTGRHRLRCNNGDDYPAGAARTPSSPSR